MGLSNSKQQATEFESNFLPDGPKHHHFFGPHHLLTNKHNPRQLLIRKEFTFRSSQQFQYVCRQYDKIQRKPFNLIYPSLMIHSGSLQHCSTVKEIYLYFEIVGKPLMQVVKTEGLLSEVKAWFLLNQISKSLEILQQNGRAHWAVSPETVYRNKTQNYLIYDSFFVLGPDQTNFLNSLKDRREPLTEPTMAALDRGLALGPAEGHQQDMYALGMTMFFAVTGIHGRKLPPFPQKYEAINNCLMERRGFISEDLIRMIKELTDGEVTRRINNCQLRKLLQQRQSDIIKRETIQYQSTHRNSLQCSYRISKTSPVRKIQLQETRRHTFNSPQLSYNQKHLHISDSVKYDIRGSPKQNKTTVSPQERSPNHDTTWQSKKSIGPAYIRNEMVYKDANLSRIPSYGQLINRG